MSLCKTAADVSLLIRNLYRLSISMKSQTLYVAGEAILNTRKRKRKAEESGKTEAG